MSQAVMIPHLNNGGITTTQYYINPQGITIRIVVVNGIVEDCDIYPVTFTKSGSFTILAGSTTKVVTHELPGLPVCSTNAFVIHRIINITDYQFTFELEAPQENDISVYWVIN
jgi:hypothetical protein